MTRSKVLQWALVVFCCFCFSFKSVADTTAPDSPTTTNPVNIDLTDGTIGYPTNGCPTGTTPASISGTTTIAFGECVNTFAVSYAINQALQGTGISIDKVHYEWKYIHCFNTDVGNGEWCDTNIENRVNTDTGEITDDTHWDELVVIVEITDSDGAVKETKTWTMDKWYDFQNSNAYSDDEVQEGSTYWQIHKDNIEIYNHIDKIGTIRTPNSLGDVRFRINGHDKGNWDGYYGPIIKDLKTYFTYRANPCSDTALYDPSCPGYSEAYAQYEYNNNCSANALYDSGCPGYATAYYNQQCSADPLYDSGCDGYATAYYNQQCSADPLYDSGCDGYEQAYFKQQCSADPLYDSGCDGYAVAYYNYQCTQNPLYDSGCDGYATAYFNQQCTANPLYDKGCDGYATAYFNQQCTASPLYDAACPGHFEAQCDASALYDIRCTGYDVAYLEQQCMYNPQYDETCVGYIAPVIDTDPIDDGTGTGDAIVDNVIEVPELIILPPVPAPAPPPVVVVVVPVEVEVEVAPVEITLEQELETEIANIEMSEELTVETVEETVEEVVVEEQTEPEAESDPRGDQINEPEEETTQEVVVEETVEEESTEENTEEVVEEKEEKKSPVIVKKTVKKPVKKKVVKLSKAEKKKAKNKKMREIIKKKLALLAVTMGKAQSLENQQALQAQIAALINFVPGFNAYGKVAIPGVNFYQPEAIYLEKKVPENQRGLRNGLAQQILHEKMIDMQYERLRE